jgi:acyl-coenzyme A synthetase/AMP-(fatty) acid ligase
LEFKPFHQAIFERAQAEPDLACLVDGATHLSYGDFVRRVRQWAAWLADNGIRKGDGIAIAMANTADHLALFVGCSAIGAVHYAIATGEIAANQAIIDTFHIATLVADSPLAYSNCRTLNLAEAKPGRDYRQAELDVPCHGDDPWKIVPSSGSTGTPKLILQTQANEVGYYSRYPAWPDVDAFRFLQTIEVKFTYGMRLCLAVLQAGGTVFMSGETPSIHEMARILVRHGITHMATTPFHAVNLAKFFAMQKTSPPALKYVRLAGAVATIHIQDMVRKHLSPNLWNLYGANEVGYMTVADPALLARLPNSIGVAAPGVEISVLDQQGRECKTGETGLLRSRGRNFPTCYFDNPGATAKSFRDGWYFPGDLASIGPGGEVMYRGRADHLMNFDGIKIAPADIEDALESHPCVQQAVAFAFPHPEHQDVPCVAVILRTPESEEELKRFARGKLAERAPQFVFIVPQIPVKGIGKPDIGALRKLALERLREKPS